MPSPKKKTAPKKAKAAYSISFTLGDQSYKGSGATVHEAMANMQRPLKIFTKGWVRLTDGKRSFEQMFMPTRAKRLFYPAAQRVLAKQLELLLR